MRCAPSAWPPPPRPIGTPRSRALPRPCASPNSARQPEAIENRLRLELGVPVEIVEPALVQVVGRKQPPIAMQLEHRGPIGHLPRLHAGVVGKMPTLAQIARCAGGHDVVP